MYRSNVAGIEKHAIYPEVSKRIQEVENASSYIGQGYSSNLRINRKRVRCSEVCVSRGIKVRLMDDLHS